MDTSRRELIKKMGRGIALAGIVAVSGTLLLRKTKAGACDFDFICRNCKKQETCELPEGQQFRSTISN